MPRMWTKEIPAPHLIEVGQSYHGIMANESSWNRYLEIEMEITDRHKANIKDRILDNDRIEDKTDASHEFFEIVVKVFERMPETDGETILGKNFYLVIPFSNTVYKRNIISGECWLVFFQTDLWNQEKKDDEILYTIAHELAHLFFEHDRGGRACAQEKEADRKVIEWGFEKELKATPHNYLFGTGFLEKCFGEVTVIRGDSK